MQFVLCFTVFKHAWKRENKTTTLICEETQHKFLYEWWKLLSLSFREWKQLALCRPSIITGNSGAMILIKSIWCLWCLFKKCYYIPYCLFLCSYGILFHHNSVSTAYSMFHSQTASAWKTMHVHRQSKKGNTIDDEHKTNPNPPLLHR